MPWESGEFDREEIDEVYTDDDENNCTVPASHSMKHTSRRRTMRKDESHLAFMTAETILGNIGKEEPTFAEDAIKKDVKVEWIDAMVDEIKSLSNNNVFKVVEKPENRKIISCRWVYALKKNSCGDIIRHKARMFAKGYSKVRGIDYDDVFAPVVRWDTMRFLLAHVARNDMELNNSM